MEAPYLPKRRNEMCLDYPIKIPMSTNLSKGIGYKVMATGADHQYLCPCQNGRLIRKRWYQQEVSGFLEFEEVKKRYPLGFHILPTLKEARRYRAQLTPWTYYEKLVIMRVKFIGIEACGMQSGVRCLVVNKIKLEERVA